MRLFKQLVVVVAVALIGSLVVNAVHMSPLPALVLGIATSALSVLAYAWVVRRTEHRAPTEVAVKGAGAALGKGLLIGVGLFTAVIVNIAFLGGYRINGWGSMAGVVGLVGIMAAASVTEELIIRGILFRILEERTGTWVALTVTGVLFGAIHLFNENASLWGAIAITIQAGGMLAAAFAATRTLWLPIGLHFGWNITASAIFSTEVSGGGTPQGLLDSATSGPVLLTGGNFGPEGSLYAVLFGALATVGFMWLAHRRGHLVPLPRRKTTVDAATTTLPQ